MIMYTNTSMVHMGIITHHSPLYEGNDQVAMAIQTFIIPLHSFNTSNSTRDVLCLGQIFTFTILERGLDLVNFFRFVPIVPRICPDGPRNCPDGPRICPDGPRICPDVPKICPDVPKNCPDVPKNYETVPMSRICTPMVWIVV